MPLNKQHFITLFGDCEHFHQEIAELVPTTAGGLKESKSLCQMQEEQSARGYLPAELVLSLKGWTVRYGSGLQGFGILRKADSFNPESALQWARHWAAQDPTKREVYVRRSSVERAEQDGHYCGAIREIEVQPMLREMEDKLGQSESEFTLSVMRRVIVRLVITDPSLLYNVYESVYFYTGDWPGGEGFGSSDFNIVCESVKKHLPTPA